MCKGYLVTRISSKPKTPVAGHWTKATCLPEELDTKRLSKALWNILAYQLKDASGNHTARTKFSHVCWMRVPAPTLTLFLCTSFIVLTI